MRKSRAPVVFRAWAVEMPRPEEQPVMRITLPRRSLVRFSSWIIWRAVGRLSPGPFGETQEAAYLDVILGVGMLVLR